LPEIPLWATSSVTASGVSAAKVVATMLVPAIYHGNERPLRKKSPVLRPARRRYARVTPIMIRKYPRINSQSVTVRCIFRKVIG
jgi:hypothetical protein